MEKVPDVFRWPEIIVNTLSLPVLLGINYYFGKKLLATKPRKTTMKRITRGARHKKTQQLNAAIFAATVCYSCCALCGVLIIWVPQMPCGPLLKVGTAIYSVSKMIMYTVFVLRVEWVYGETAHAYNKRTLHALLAFCWILGTVVVVSSLITTKPEREKQQFVVDCNPRLPPWLPSLLAFVDVVMSASCLWMFTRPLNTLANDQQIEFDRRQANGSKRRLSSKSMKLQKLAIRYTVVTWTAVCTTLLFLLTVITMKTTVFGGIDMVINSICLGLMTNWYDEHFERLCVVSLCIARWCVCCNFGEMYKVRRVQSYLGNQSDAPTLARIPTDTAEVELGTAKQSNTSTE